MKRAENDYGIGGQVSDYEPELGQALFGNACSEFDADELSETLYDLSKFFAQRDPEAQRHGLLGGSYGYAQHFTNSVFEMHPYYWGDCDCGYDEREEEWSRSNKHAADCYQSALVKARKDAGFADYSAENFAEQLAAEDRRFGSYEAKRAAEDKIYHRLTTQHNLPMEGCAVHCTCDHGERWRIWSAENNHDQKCPIVVPNFRHFASGLEIRWYKYIGRGMSANRKLSADDFKRIVDECKLSAHEGVRQ